jgi:sugar lactone lactonase YvrE
MREKKMQHLSTQIELLVDEKALLAEGPSWCAQNQVLYWVNILERKVYVYNPTTRSNHTISIQKYPGCVVPRKKMKNSVAIAATDENSSGFAFVGKEIRNKVKCVSRI